jgi:hypothetical protein
MNFFVTFGLENSLLRSAHLFWNTLYKTVLLHRYEWRDVQLKHWKDKFKYKGKFVCVLKLCATKTYGGVEVKLDVFLPRHQYRWVLTVSNSNRLNYLWGKSPRYPLVGDLVGPRAVLQVVAKKIIPVLPGIEARSWSPLPFTSLTTYYSGIMTLISIYRRHGIF